MTEWPTPSKEAPFSYTNCNEPTVAAYKPRAQADLPLWARRLHATTSSLAPGLRGGITFRAVEGRGAERRADRINLACARMVVGAVNRLAKRAASTDLPGSDVQLMVAGLWAGGSTLTMMLMDESLKRAMLRSLLASETQGSFGLDSPVRDCALYFPLRLVDGLDRPEFTAEFTTATGAPASFNEYASALQVAIGREDARAAMVILSNRVHRWMGYSPPAEDVPLILMQYGHLTSQAAPDFRAVGLSGPPETEIGRMLLLANESPSSGLSLGDVRKYLRS